MSWLKPETQPADVNANHGADLGFTKGSKTMNKVIAVETAERLGTAIYRRAIEIGAAVGNQAGYGTNPVPESLNTTPFPTQPPGIDAVSKVVP